MAKIREGIKSTLASVSGIVGLSKEEKTDNNSMMRYNDKDERTSFTRISKKPSSKKPSSSQGGNSWKNDALKWGRIILAMAVLTGYAKKETQESQNGEAPKSVLSVGSLGVPLFKVDMNSGNKDSDFYARLFLADKVNQVVGDKIAELFEKSSKGEELPGTNEFYHENGLISSNTFYNENGVRTIEKHYENGGKTIEEYYENGQLKSKEGVDKDGGTTYEEYYENGRLKGKANVDKDGRKTYVSYYENGWLKSKQGVDKDGGTIYEEYYENGQLEYEESADKDGRKTYVSYYENGWLKSKQGVDKDGGKTYEEYYENGQLMRKRDVYKDGKETYEEYYENGQLMCKRDVDKDGKETYEEYYENGRLKMSAYHDEAKNRVAEAYSKEGELRVKVYADDEIYFYKGGHMNAKAVCKDGVGSFEEYHNNGVLSLKGVVEAEDLYRLCEEYYVQSDLSIEDFYHEGKMSGTFERYNDEGTLIGRDVYKDGVRVSSDGKDLSQKLQVMSTPLKGNKKNGLSLKPIQNGGR